MKSPETGKAFIQTATKKLVEKSLNLDIGTGDFSELIGLFSTDVSLEDLDRITWNGKNYRVKNVWDGPPIEDEIIYQVCELERIDT